MQGTFGDFQLEGGTVQTPLGTVYQGDWGLCAGSPGHSLPFLEWPSSGGRAWHSAPKRCVTGNDSLAQYVRVLHGIWMGLYYVAACTHPQAIGFR